MIQRLKSDVISELRSGVALSSLSQCVEELVLNSIDAGSTSITVDVDVSTVSLEVSDNGSGMCRSDLKTVGQRYFTSKCHSLHDLHNAASYGFRGEALASLGKICQKVEIVSRHKASSLTFCKHVKKGCEMGVYESTSLRPKHGTTVKTFGVFYALPVRQKLISEKVDLEQIRRHVLGLALMNPGVSFLVRNKDNGTTILSINACNSALSVISQVFGCSKSKSFRAVSLTSGVYTVTGYVSLEGYSNRNFQFFYVNKRLVLKTKLHHVANQVLGRAITGLVTMEHEFTDQDSKPCSPKKLDRYAGFVINLDCPYVAYDITFDPKKTFVEFQNWDRPIYCLKECLLDFLKKEGIFNDAFSNAQSDSQESCPGLSEGYDLVKVDSESGTEYPNVSKRPIKPSDLRRSLCSSTAKRRRNENPLCNTGIVCPSGDSCKPNESSGDVTKFGPTSNTEETVFPGDSSLSSGEFSCSSKRIISFHRNASSSVLNKVGNSSKRSIVSKLQKYSTGIPTNIDCPSDSNRALSSLESGCNERVQKKAAGIRSMKIDSVKSNSVEKYTCLEMGKEVVEINEWYSREQSNNPRIPLEAECLRMVNSSTITKEKPPIKNSRNVRFQTVNSNVTCSTTDHCSMLEANIIGKNQRLLKDSQILDSKKENSNSGFFQEASANKLTGHNVVAKADTADPTISNNATAETNDESELLRQDSDWLLQHNPRDGRPLYINLRTGNTSATVPDTKPAPRMSTLEGRTTPTERAVDSTKQRPFRDYASHLSHNFTPWLPRSAITSGENCDVSKGGAKQSSEIRNMFDQWVNPVFERNERRVVDASFTESSKTLVKPQNTAQPFKFTKGCFSKMKVIGQVDNKFILCHYKSDEKNEDSFLVAVDQHAAHERVRLESFIKELYADSQHPGDKMAMRSSPLSTPCELSMSDHDIHLMQAFRVQLAQVGITFVNVPRSSSDVQSSVCIKTVPSVFLARESVSHDGEKLRSEIKNCIEDLIKEQIEAMLCTKGAPTTALPKAITKVLNSQACHGAIRFGDSLSTEECVDLMASLSTCDLPFQCAHGRPSMIPLVNTKLTQNAVSKKFVVKSPQISRIRKLREGMIL